MREREIGQILYYLALGMWLVVALLKYTYFRDMIPMSLISRRVMYTVWGLLFVKFLLDCELKLKNVFILAVMLLLSYIAYEHNSLQFATMFFLIYGAHNVPFRRLCYFALLMQVTVFLATIAAMKYGILEDVIWDETTRGRHGLGFTHCMLASHFGFFMAMLWAVVRQKIDWFAFLVILGGNIILYCYTGGRTDFALSIGFALVALFLCTFEKKLPPANKWIASILSLAPVSLCIGSIGLTMLYHPDSALFQKLNSVLSQRLSYGKSAIAEYGFSAFGQKIVFVGMSALYYKPEAEYNYVDNGYLMTTLQYGLVFISLFCLAMGVLLYRLARSGQWLLVLCVLFSLLFGVFNPQMMYLTYDTFLLLLPQAFEEILLEERRLNRSMVV